MNVAEITMPVEDAKRAYREYRDAIRKRHTREDAAIMQGYRALARGQRLIDLHQSIAMGGLDEKHRPRLAICRADAKWCWFDWHEDMASFTRHEGNWGRGDFRYGIKIPSALLPRPRNSWSSNAKALVPLVPPQFVPTGRMSSYYILWEAEWQASPPKDPMLLKHLSGALYVVLAHWDLTELERAVLARRFSDQ